MTGKAHMQIGDLAEAVSAAQTRAYPPVNQWNPAHVGAIDIRITANGDWLHEGGRIRRPALVKLFASVLRRDDDGVHYLVTPVERLAIQVDVAPLFVTEIFVENPGNAQNIIFRTSTDDVATLDAGHPLSVSINAESGEPTPLALIRERLQGLLSRSVFYDLAELAEERDFDGVRVQGVISAGGFHPIGRSDGRPLEASA